MGGPPTSLTVNLQCHGIVNQKIPQLDGNQTIYSCSDMGESICSCCNNVVCCDSTVSSDDSKYDNGMEIPVITSSQKMLPNDRPWQEDPPAWYDEYIVPVQVNTMLSKSNRITIKRDNRLVMSESLPIISVSNVRSLHPKLKNFKKDLIEREISLSLISEVWEKTTCKKQRFEIESMCQIEGLKYISTPRLNKRGGGAAIVVALEKYSLDKIEICNPDRLEVVWGIVRPKKVPANIKEIIVAAFYSPPKSKKNPLLLDHLISTTQSLLTKYPNAGVVVGGDKMT